MNLDGAKWDRLPATEVILPETEEIIFDWIIAQLKAVLEGEPV